MSTIAEAIVEVMLADDDVTDLIGDRLYPNFAPQDADKPSIVYMLTDTQHVNSRDGASHLARSTYQFTCEAETYAGAVALALAVRECWQNVRNTVVLDLEIYGALIMSDTDEYSETHATHVVRLDVAYWHTEGVIITIGGTT